ncbi:MAG: zinc-ribbon domain-containing protein [Candidatus Heimdallarchaeota archaeon]|nr:zinc-ribbon domain-containing protein [Candidatus Heimdallarchaeota archaeon]
MTKKRSKFDKITWIITELVLGLVALVYGLYGVIDAHDPQVLYIILASVGCVLTLFAVVQIVIERRRKKQDKIIHHCPKCGKKVEKEDEFCRKCGEKVE